jgi:hypothetical protein
MWPSNQPRAINLVKYKTNLIISISVVINTVRGTDTKTREVHKAIDGGHFKVH